MSSHAFHLFSDNFYFACVSCPFSANLTKFTVGSIIGFNPDCNVKFEI